MSVKPFSSIPSLSLWSLVWRGIRNQNPPNKPFKGWQQLQQEFGDILALNLPGQKVVMIFDADKYESVFRLAGKYPAELQIGSWLEVERRRKKKDPNYEVNPIALKGEEWRENRTSLDNKLLRVEQVNQYMPIINGVASDLTQAMKTEIQTSGSIENVEDLFYSFSIEGIGSVLFNKRLNLISEGSTMPESAKEFVDVLKVVFCSSGELEVGFPFYRWFDTKQFRTLSESLYRLEEIAEKFVEECDEFHKDTPVDQRQDLVQYLRNRGQSEERTLRNAIMMFIAGSDSTTHTLQWLVHNLGRNIEAQAKLREEVLSVLGPEQQVTPETMNSLKYLKACLKESMRRTPSVAGIGRIPSEDAVAAGYEIPKGTMVVALKYLSNHDPRFFSEPDQFLPERWIDADKKPNPFYNLPFGFGPRMCQGVRIAELEIYVLMTHLIRNFSWESKDENPEAVSELFLKPERPINISWKLLQK
jgi:cytochrome P450